MGVADSGLTVPEPGAELPAVPWYSVTAPVELITYRFAVLPVASSPVEARTGYVAAGRLMPGIAVPPDPKVTSVLPLGLSDGRLFTT
jgi:hypothetical protein